MASEVYELDCGEAEPVFLERSDDDVAKLLLESWIAEHPDG